MDAQTTPHHARLGDDLLVGAQSIGDYLGLTERQVFGLHQGRNIPSFKLGALIAARKSELDRQLSASAGPAAPAPHVEREIA